MNLVEQKTDNTLRVTCSTTPLKVLNYNGYVSDSLELQIKPVLPQNHVSPAPLFFSILAAALSRGFISVFCICPDHQIIINTLCHIDHIKFF